MIEEDAKRECPGSKAEDTFLPRRPFAMKAAQEDRTENERAHEIDTDCHALENLAVDCGLCTDTHGSHKEREEKAPFQNAHKRMADALIRQGQNDCKQNTERHSELDALFERRHQLL